MATAQSRGPLPFDLANCSCRNLLEQAERRGQGCCIFSHYLRVFVTKLCPELSSKGFKQSVLRKPRSRTAQEAPKIKKLCMFIRINRLTREVLTANHLILRGAADRHGLQGGRRSEVEVGAERGPSGCWPASWF